MPEKKSRRQHPTEEKATILRRHLVDKAPVSDLCDEYHLQPSVVYGWLRQVTDRLEATLASGNSKRAASRERELEQRVAHLEARLARKDAIIADISEEHLRLKKTLGEA